MTLLRAAWTNAISRVFGAFASKKHPYFIQLAINRLYVKFTGVDLSKFEPISHYKSLNELFTRELKYQREFSKDPISIISPCDSLVSDQGKIDNGKAYQIKGFDYSIKELLSDHVEKEDFELLEGGDYINFYLSPKDYHRYHVPMDMKVLRVIHVPGALYPVNFKYLHKVRSLFVKNERVIIEALDMSNRLFYIVLVGALNVGKMTLKFETKIDTNVEGIVETRVFEYKDGEVELNKGDELGMFMMGSTIVMFFEKDFVDLEDKKGKSVRFADVIAKKRS
jgi:phosphatidylserine decarboxylase